MSITNNRVISDIDCYYKFKMLTNWNYAVWYHKIKCSKWSVSNILFGRKFLYLYLNCPTCSRHMLLHTNCSFQPCQSSQIIWQNDLWLFHIHNAIKWIEKEPTALKCTHTHTYIQSYENIKLSIVGVRDKALSNPSHTNAHTYIQAYQIWYST